MVTAILSYLQFYYLWYTAVKYWTEFRWPIQHKNIITHKIGIEIIVIVNEHDLVEYK